MASWPIRRKLIAIAATPMILIIGAGLLLTSQSISKLRTAQVSRDLMVVARATNSFTTSLNAELNATLGAQRTPDDVQLRANRDAKRKATDASYARLAAALADPPSGKWSADLADAIDKLENTQSRLPNARAGADNGFTAMVLTTRYGNQLEKTRQLSALLARELTITSLDGDTVDAASTLSALEIAADAAAQEQVTLTTALEEHRLAGASEEQVVQYKVIQDTQLDLAAAHGSDDQRSDIAEIRLDDRRIDGFRTDAIEAAKAGGAGGITQAQVDAANEQAASYQQATSAREAALNALVEKVIATTLSSEEAKARQALTSTAVIAALALLTLLAVSVLVTMMARTITSPMRRLRSGAVDAATVRLPAAVRQIERDGPDAAVELPPVLPEGTVAGPETLEVARAVDGLTNEAVRLATVQVRLRAAIDEAFVSMSRRSQSMVEKQLAIIDELEQSEEDPDQLRNLFRLDHLAARMRRYNDNLLVLADSPVRTRSSAPVPIADVFRAATSEMEQYERVRLQPTTGVSIAGPAAGGLIHLLAELLDNAAMYSPPTSPILLSASSGADGSLLIEVTDSGVGIPPAELADLNGRLAMPGTIDTTAPSRMGLYVVARLALRGGFSVRLSGRGDVSGTTAQVTVPASLVLGRDTAGATTTGPQPVGRGRGAGTEAPRGDERSALAARRIGPLGAPGAPVGAGAGFGALGANGSAAAGPADGELNGGGLPRRPMSSPGWRETRGTAPGDPAAPAAPAAGAPGALPSRRPGAALSQVPLSNAAPARPLPRRNEPFRGAAEQSRLTPFDAFGAVAGSAPATESAPVAPSGPSGPAGAGTPERPGAGDPPSGEPLAGPQDRTEPLPRRAPRAFVQPGPEPARPSGTPDHSGPVTGPGRAAAAAAAAARARSTGPVPGAAPSGLFAATGPATLPGGLSRTGGGPAAGDREPSTGALAAGLAGTPARPVDPKPASGASAPGTPPAGSAVSGSGLRERPLVTDRTDRVERLGRFAGAERADRVDSSLPTEREARVAASTRYHPADPHAPMIGSDEAPDPEASTPIFEAMSAWFASEAGAAGSAAAESRPAGTPATVGASPAPSVIDLRESGGSVAAVPVAAATASGGGGNGSGSSGSGSTGSGSRWAALADQRWVSTNARAASSPEVSGQTEAGLPRRRPGANLLPSAAAAAPSTQAPGARADADQVRGRLGSYQRGLASARQARTGGSDAPAETQTDTGGAVRQDSGDQLRNQEGEQ